MTISRRAVRHLMSPWRRQLPLDDYIEVLSPLAGTQCNRILWCCSDCKYPFCEWHPEGGARILTGAEAATRFTLKTLRSSRKTCYGSAPLGRTQSARLQACSVQFGAVSSAEFCYTFQRPTATSPAGSPWSVSCAAYLSTLGSFSSGLAGRSLPTSLLVRCATNGTMAGRNSPEAGKQEVTARCIATTRDGPYSDKTGPFPTGNGCDANLGCIAERNGVRWCGNACGHKEASVPTETSQVPGYRLHTEVSPERAPPYLIVPAFRTLLETAYCRTPFRPSMRVCKLNAVKARQVVNCKFCLVCQNRDALPVDERKS